MTRLGRCWERHKPRFFLPAGHAGLISFYDDYIAHGVLFAADGTQISDAVTPHLLNRYKNDPLVSFAHRALPAKTRKCRRLRAG